MKSNLFVFSSVASSFGVISKNLLLNSRSWRYDLMFSYKSFIVLALTFKSLIHFELIFLIWHNIGTELHSFAFGYLSLHLLEKKKNDWMVLVLLSKNHLTKKTKSFDHKYMSLFLRSQICYTNLYIYPCAIPHCLDYSFFVVSFEINVIFHINRLKKKNYMIIPINGEHSTKFNTCL